MQHQGSRPDRPFLIGILAGTVVLALPPVVLFVIFQRYFVETETSASVKE